MTRNNQHVSCHIPSMVISEYNTIRQHLFYSVPPVLEQKGKRLCVRWKIHQHQVYVFCNASRGHRHELKNNTYYGCYLPKRSITYDKTNWQLTGVSVGNQQALHHSLLRIDNMPTAVMHLEIIAETMLLLALCQTAKNDMLTLISKQWPWTVMQSENCSWLFSTNEGLSSSIKSFTKG